MPTVSVVTPTQSRLSDVGELLEALARQTFDDFEVLLVNNAGAPLDEVVELYPELKIEVLELPVPSSHVWARNAALPHARGEWIMPIDDDRRIVPDHIEIMLGAAHETGADLLYGDAEICEYTEKAGVRVPKSRFLFAYDFDPALLRRYRTYVSSGSLYRRGLHDGLGPFDPEMRDVWDWDWMLRVLEAGCRAAKVPRAGTLCAIPAGNGKGRKDRPAALPETWSVPLEKLAARHELSGEPMLFDFLDLLEEPELRARRSVSDIVWDGEPIVSRYRLP